MNILYVIPSLNNGGIEKMVENWIRGAINRGHHCDVLAFYSGENNVFSLLGCNTYVKDVKSLHYFSSKRVLLNFFKEHHNYNIVHSNVGFLGGLVSYTAKVNIPSVKTLCHAHLNGRQSFSSTLSKFVNEFVQKKYSSMISKWSDINLACSYASGDFLFKSSRYTFFPNAINTCHFGFDEIARTQYRKLFGFSESDFIIIHVGRFSNEKNHKFLLSIFELITELRSDAHLVLIGNGELKKMIEQMCLQSKRLEKKVHFLGYRSDVSELYSMSDVFVLPSLIEGFPVSVVEAQTNGLFCIVSEATPQEAELTKSIKRLPLSSGKEIWAKSIINADLNIDRFYQESVVKSKGFNTNESIDTLFSLYGEGS